MVVKAKVVKRATIPVSIPMDVVEKIEGLRVKLGYRSRNQVIREAIKRLIEEIEETKVIYIGGMTLEQAKRKMLEHLKRRGSAYVSEIAEDLGIDIELAFKAAEELEKEGTIGE